MRQEEHIIICLAQVDAFNVEFTCICHASASKDGRPPTPVAQFNLFVDYAGILRARSYLKTASLTLDGVQPILLPKNL